MAHYERLVQRQVSRLIKAVVQAHHTIHPQLRLDLAQLVRAAKVADAGMRPAVQSVANGLDKVRKIRTLVEDYGDEPPVNFGCFHVCRA